MRAQDQDQASQKRRSTATEVVLNGVNIRDSFPPKQTNGLADEGVVYEERLPISRLSRIFDVADVPIGGPAPRASPPVTSRTRNMSAGITKPLRETLPVPSSGIPKSNSVGNVSRLPPRADGETTARWQPPVAPKPVGLSARPTSIVGAPKPPAGVINPFLGSGETTPETRSRTVSMEKSSPEKPQIVVSTMKVSDRIAALAAATTVESSAPPRFIPSPGRPSASSTNADQPVFTPKKKPPPPPLRPSSAVRSNTRSSYTSDSTTFEPTLRFPSLPSRRPPDEDSSRSGPMSPVSSEESPRVEESISVRPRPSLTQQRPSITKKYVSPPTPPAMGRDGSTESYISGLASAVGSDDGNSSIGTGMTKREKVVREMVETERRYLSDMQTLKEIYMIPGSERDGLSSGDLKILFINPNLDGVITVAADFLADLELAASEEPDWVGKALLKHLKAIEEAYGTYCKHNEAAMNKLAEFASPDCGPSTKQFLKECQMQLQGRTGAWDLSSLIIKPVQRVLKYPLLIKELLKETPPKHHDFEDLVTCFAEVEKVAEKINELKKRKDTVEKYVEGKGKKNAMHGITKKFTRGVQELKQATGAVGDFTVDENFDHLVESLNVLHAKAQTLSRDLMTWCLAAKSSESRWSILANSEVENMELLESIAISLEEVYQLAPTVTGKAGYKHVALEYRRACARLAAGAWKQAEVEIKEYIIPVLNNLLLMFKEPFLVVKKREKKRLDFDRARAIKAKGDPVEKALEQSADDYTALHSELADQLPKYLLLTSQALDHIIVAVNSAQATVYEEVRNQLEPVAESLASSRMSTAMRRQSYGGAGVSRRWPEGEIIGRYREQIDDGDVLRQVKEIEILETWRAEVYASAAVEPRESKWNFFGQAASPKSEDSRSRRSSVNRRPSRQQRSSESQQERTPSESERAYDYDEDGEDDIEAVSNVGSNWDFGREVNIAVRAVFEFTAELEDELDLETMPPPPTKEQRQRCWKARDEYFQCLDAKGMWLYGLKPASHDEIVNIDLTRPPIRLDTDKTLTKDEKAVLFSCKAQHAMFYKECLFSWYQHFSLLRVKDLQKEYLVKYAEDKVKAQTGDGAKEFWDRVAKKAP
ncbi:hypothetical protein HK101_008538 [Irineochytrium annulatum]|nr:hypothetical protein HK101_008538 [Irineochytrium annulatum]